MFGFGNKPKKQRKKSKSKYDMFPLSEPWGYYPEAVHKTILQYENTLKGINRGVEAERQKNARQLASLSRKIEEKDKEILGLKEELREMHIQMSNLELPEADFITESVVLDNFRKYNRVEDDSNEPEKRISKPKETKSSDGNHPFTIIE